MQRAQMVQEEAQDPRYTIITLLMNFIVTGETSQNALNLHW